MANKKTSVKKTAKKNIKTKTKKEATQKKDLKKFFINCKDDIVNKCKKLTLKNYINIGLLLLIICTSAHVFFSYKMMFFPDSKHYYQISKIILGDLGISHWQLVRGFGFPLIASSWILLFGDNQTGVITGSYIYYLILIFIIGYFIQRFIKKNELNNRFIFIFLYILLVVFNPLIIGYQHTFLTESVMPTIYLISILVFFNWYKLNYKDNKIKIIILNIIMALLGILTWFIKQPFAPSYFAGLLLTAILSGIYYKNRKMFYRKLITVGICIVSLIVSIYTWNAFMQSQIKKEANDINNSYLTGGILSGLNVYYYQIPKDTYCNKEYIDNLHITKGEKNKIKKIMKNDSKNWCQHILVYEIRNDYNHFITNEVIISNDTNISVIERTAFLIKNMFKHPNYVFKSYFYNYLAISDIQERNFSNGYRSSREYSRDIWGENLSNGELTFVPHYATLGFYSNGLMDQYATHTVEHKTMTELLMINNDICFYLYKLSILFALPIFMYGLVRFIKIKDEQYFIICIISGMCFVNAFFNVFMGAIIDRYVYPMYPAMLLCLFILMMEKKKIRSDVNEKQR